MVLMTLTLDLSNTAALDVFDTVTHMAFGDGISSTDSGQIALQNELLRVLITTATKDTINNEYTFTGRIPLPQLNSSTINEVGLFDAVTGGTMAGRVLSPIAVTKTDSDEIIYKLRIRVNTINN